MPHTSSALVSLSDLHLTLKSQAGSVDILKGIDLEINAGDTVSVVGPSGAGKSSMMMLMAGLEAATSGRVTIDGKDLGAMDEDALARFRRDGIGIVFQDFHLIPTMTALENVAVSLEFARKPDALARARARLESVGLGHRLDHFPGQLSGGEQQRVALARAFAAEPKLLLADEPTGNLDSATGDIIIDLLFSLQKDHGTTLVLITHDPRLAKRCNRTVVLKDGLLSEQHSPTEKSENVSPASGTGPRVASANAKGHA
ncbi:ABC transporter ATP-binding protein [Kiloniella laminariae]|uniref:ABC transporter ATP-binding protein n=1 Tax=Kiloniella laminariae TaxID=454162 RepID=A0ABT4LIV9_9PROT|nr:ABC transporter ATP-binding protein [Kiloniella laminariae]MCZ4281044.1 ABC transporter ATP-binding protein [Kiloniella laminariae]